MNIPTDLKYTKEHEWIRVEGDTATVGITEFAQGELGDVVFIEVETVGETLFQGDTFGSIEAVKTVSDLFLPVGGEILTVNEKIADKPELINNDPYGEGWIIRMHISNAKEIDGLMDAKQYQAMLNS